MSWRVALIDSCGHWPGAMDTAAFASDSGVLTRDAAMAGDAVIAGRTPQVERRATVADRSGHGSRIAGLLTAGDVSFELLLGQVFLGAGPTSSAAVAAAIDWAAAGRADLIHMSLGLEADRAVLAVAVRRAISSGCIIVASTPARGGVVYPAAYPEVIRATGDARCGAGQLSYLGPWFFGGCPRFAASGPADSGAGASVGAAWVTRSILAGPKQGSASTLVATLAASARFQGPERRGYAPAR